MCGFKDQLHDDLAEVFINPEEFGAEHEFNGKTILCVIDEDLFFERGKSGTERIAYGVFPKSISIFIRKNELGYKPKIEEGVTFDGEYRRVADVIETEELYEIQMEAYDH